MKKSKKEGIGLKTKIILSLFAVIIFCVCLFFKQDIAKSLHLNVDYREHQASFEQISESDFKVAYLDVGQGSCSVIEFPDGKVLVIDGGSAMYGERIYQYLLDENMTKIDYMIATHADADHIGGLNYLFDKFEIENIYRPMQIAGTEITYYDDQGGKHTTFEVFEEEDLKDEYEAHKTKFVKTTTATYRNFISNVYNETYTDGGGQTKNSNVFVFYNGLSETHEDYSIDFYAPFVATDDVEFNDRTQGVMTKKYSDDSSNSSSAIFVVTIMDKKFLFTGDAPAYDEKFEINNKYEESDLVLNGDMSKLANIDVYLVAHHGSKYSSSARFLSEINPKFCVVSVGKNTYGHPNSDVLERISNLRSINYDGITNTQSNGNIIFAEIDDNLVYVLQKTEKESKLTLGVEVFLVICLVTALVFIFNLKVPSKSKKGRARA